MCNLVQFGLGPSEARRGEKSCSTHCLAVDATLTNMRPQTDHQVPSYMHLTSDAVFRCLCGNALTLI
jgi:hypothetical protein